jgi:hypothetical protein
MFFLVLLQDLKFQELTNFSYFWMLNIYIHISFALLHYIMKNEKKNWIGGSQIEMKRKFPLKLLIILNRCHHQLN